MGGVIRAVQLPWLGIVLVHVLESFEDSCRLGVVETTPERRMELYLADMEDDGIPESWCFVFMPLIGHSDRSHSTVGVEQNFAGIFTWGS